MMRGGYSILAVLGAFLALAAAAAAVLAGVLYRFEQLALGDAFALLVAAAWSGLAAALVALCGMLRARPGTPRRGFLLALFGLLLGGVVAWVPWNQKRIAESLPAIHDISTDTGDPPRFQAVQARRPDAANSLEYGGETLAEKQHRAYPAIQPLRLDAPPDAVFGAALSLVRERGWELVVADAQSGRIEAVATTRWFGFRDDVVIRVRATDTGSRFDMRSVSRVGVSDVGANAARIRAFLAALREGL